MALRIMPSTNTAVNFLNLGKYAEAAGTCQQILDIEPNEIVAQQVMGLSLLRMRRDAEAKVFLDRAMLAQPRNIGFLMNYAVAAAETGDWAAVDRITKKVEAIDPRHIGNINLIGCVKRNDMLLDAAEAEFRRAIAIKPDFEQGLTNLGTTLWMKGDLDAAKAVLGECMRLYPGRGAAELAYGAILLEQGQWDTGWKMYESRWTSKEAKPRRYLDHPRWTGQDLTGKRILIYGEQGLGDSLQFVRYAKLLKDRGAWVSVESEQAVKTLMARCSGVDEAHGFGDQAPAFDYQAAMLDLPGPLGTRVDNVPADVPYITALPERVAAWKEKLKNDPPGLKVGIVWAGNPQNSRDNLRSIPLFDLLSWASVPGVTWYSMQLGHKPGVSWDSLQPDPANARPKGWKMIDLAPAMTGFEESAAIVAALDLVITVDTATAHLAGATARPVWVLLPRWGDWRWMQGTTDTPWYPTMRLFRQVKLPDWSVPIAGVQEALAEQVAGR